MNMVMMEAFRDELTKIAQGQSQNWGIEERPERFTAGNKRYRVLKNDRYRVRTPPQPTAPPVEERTAPAPAPAINFNRPGSSGPKFKPQPIGGQSQVAPKLPANGMTGRLPQAKKPTAPKFNTADFQKAMGQVKKNPSMGKVRQPFQP